MYNQLCQPEPHKGPHESTLIHVLVYKNKDSSAAIKCKMPRSNKSNSRDVDPQEPRPSKRLRLLHAQSRHRQDDYVSIPPPPRKSELHAFALTNVILEQVERVEQELQDDAS